MDVLDQSVSVTFRFPVYFTTGLLDPTNLVLRTVTTIPTDPAPSDAIVVIDDGVERTHPTIQAKLAAYFAAHGDVLAASPRGRLAATTIG